MFWLQLFWLVEGSDSSTIVPFQSCMPPWQVTETISSIAKGRKGAAAQFSLSVACLAKLTSFAQLTYKHRDFHEVRSAKRLGLLFLLVIALLREADGRLVTSSTSAYPPVQPTHNLDILEVYTSPTIEYV